MAVKVVIDTNIWVSSLLNPFGFSAKLRKAFEEGVFHIIISEPMVEELIDVLSRPRIRDKYEIAEDDIKELLILIEDRAEHTLISRDINICRDKDDNFIIETAIKGQAKYLVTRDDDMKFDKQVTSFLLQNGVSILSLSQFLNLINS